MRVVLVGGDFRQGYQVTGYVNAVRHIAAGLAEGDEVSVIPLLPQRPQLTRNRKWKGTKVLSKRPGVGVMAQAVLEWPRAWGRTGPYMRMYHDRNAVTRAFVRLKYSLAYSLNRSFFRDSLRKVRPEVVHVHGVNIQTLPFLDELLDDDVPFVTTCHGLYSFDPSSFAEADSELEEDIYRALGKDGRMVAAVSRRLADELKRSFQMPPDTLRVVHNGVEPMKVARDRSLLRRKHGIPEDRTVVLTVGTIGGRKNQRAVLEALQAMTPDERGRMLFLVVGGGDANGLRDEVRSMGLDDHVIIKGVVSADAIGEMYALSDIFSLTSTSEGFALVMLEALSAGLPLVTYADLEGVDELTTSYGLTLVPARDAGMLAKAIIEASDIEWDQAVIRKGVERFDWGHVCSEYLSIYREAVGRSLSRGR